MFAVKVTRTVVNSINAHQPVGHEIIQYHGRKYRQSGVTMNRDRVIGWNRKADAKRYIANLEKNESPSNVYQRIYEIIEIA